jgi:hypothetical protein
MNVTRPDSGAGAKASGRLYVAAVVAWLTFAAELVGIGALLARYA